MKKRALRDMVGNGRACDDCARLRAATGRTRLKILLILNEVPRGMTVSELADILSMSVSRVSHQLRPLKQARLVSSESRGREVVYRLGRRLPIVLRKCS